MTPTLQINQLRLGEMKALGQGYRAGTRAQTVWLHSHAVSFTLPYCISFCGVIYPVIHPPVLSPTTPQKHSVSASSFPNATLAMTVYRRNGHNFCLRLLTNQQGKDIDQLVRIYSKGCPTEASSSHPAGGAAVV